MKIDTNQEYLNRIKKAKCKTRDKKNNTIQDILIRFMIYTIQGIMIPIIIHDQQETKAKRHIDMIQNNVNRIKDLKKRFYHSTKKIFTQQSHT